MADPIQTPPANAAEPPATPTDHSLLRRLRDGNDRAATEIYLRYAQRLRTLARARCSADLARRVDVDDIVQSVFSSFFRGVNGGYYDVPVGEELWKLLLVIGVLLAALGLGAAGLAVMRTVSQPAASAPSSEPLRTEAPSATAAVGRQTSIVARGEL